jgi:HK97 gp10 family phage protein
MNNAERRALYAAGKYMRDEERKVTPVAEPGQKLPEGQKRGDLKRSIKHRVNGRQMKVTVYTAAGRGLWLDRGTKTKDGHIRISPRNFFEPTFAKYKGQAIKVFESSFRERMEKIQ